MNCYFDGSVGGRSDEWLTLGGLIATDRVWARFQKDWTEMLQNREPIAPYVHMTDLITGNRPYRGDSGWVQDKVQKLVVDVVQLLASIPKNEICAFACSIDVKARTRLTKLGHKVPPPAVLCAELGLVKLIQWYGKTHGIEMVHLFYDRGEPFIRSIREGWVKSKAKKRLVTTDIFWGSIANIQPVNMQDTPAIQAADVIAWAFTRRIRNAPGDKWAHLADTLIGTREHRGLLNSIQTDPIDEAMMIEKHPRVK